MEGLLWVQMRQFLGLDAAHAMARRIIGAQCLAVAF